MDKLIFELLQKNNIKNISKSELKLQISSHPSYPSLNAITGVLDHFGIENLALDIPQTKEVFTQLPSSFIAHLKNENSEDIAFITKKDTQVKIKYSNKKSLLLSKEDFLEYWTGIIIAIDKDENTINKTIAKNILQYIPIIILIGITTFTYSYYVNFSAFQFLHLLLSVSGIYVGSLIIKHELGINSQVVDKICTSTKKTSCDAVLQSKGASIFGLFKLSDVSFVYFVSLFIITLFISVTNIIKFNTVAIVNLVTVPVVLYSIYYQAFIVKKWCPLCLATGSILVFQAAIAYFYNPIILPLNLSELLLLSIIIFSVILLYSHLKYFVSSNLHLSKEQVAYYKFKRNFSLFETLHFKQPILNTTIVDFSEITFGNVNAVIDIVVITNPMCSFCKKTHQSIENLLKAIGDNIKVTIRFNISTDDVDNYTFKVSNILISLYQNNVALCREAMHQIYTEGVNIDKWLEKYDMYSNNNQKQILEQEKQWCNANNINFTPAVYLNNKEYPKEYDLTDLAFFIDEMEELNTRYSNTKTEKSNEKEVDKIMS